MTTYCLAPIMYGYRYSHANVLTYTYTYICSVYSHVQKNASTYIDIYIHTYTCTYIYAQTHTLNPPHQTDALIPAKQAQRGKGAVE